MTEPLETTNAHQAGMLEAADLVDEIATWLREEQQEDDLQTMQGPKTKVGWLKKAAREIRARAQVPQEGVWFTEQETDTSQGTATS